MIQQQQRTAESGLTLVELVIALSIFIILAAGLSASMVAGLRLNSDTRSRDDAREAARSQMEIILAWNDYDTLAANYDGATFSHGTVGVDATNPDLLEIRLTVTWEASTGPLTFQLVTMIANTSGVASRRNVAARSSELQINTKNLVLEKQPRPTLHLTRHHPCCYLPC